MNGGQTRAQIVQAADQLFYRQGFAASTFADIACEVGISRGNFYYHYQSKDEILEAVILLRLCTSDCASKPAPIPKSTRRLPGCL